MERKWSWTWDFVVAIASPYNGWAFLLLRNTPPRPASNQQTYSDVLISFGYKVNVNKPNPCRGVGLMKGKHWKIYLWLACMHTYLTANSKSTDRVRIEWFKRRVSFFSRCETTKKNHYVYNSSSRRRESGPLTWRDYAAAMMTMKISETFSFSSLQWLMKISKIIFDEKLPQ